jgi:hypothetical protein
VSFDIEGIQEICTKPKVIRAATLYIKVDEEFLSACLGREVGSAKLLRC